jgi:hypothetical protein
MRGMRNPICMTCMIVRRCIINLRRANNLAILRAMAHAASCRRMAITGEVSFSFDSSIRYEHPQNIGIRHSSHPI